MGTGLVVQNNGIPTPSPEFTASVLRGDKMRIREILGANRFDTYTKSRDGSRAVIIRDNQILLSHETVSGFWLIPGGGMEEGETPEECVVREVLEETGLIVRPTVQFLTLHEYYEEYRYTSHYFVCEVTGEAQQHLTEDEKRRGLVPEWISLREAMDLFSKHESYAAVSEEKRGAYLREYMALSEFMDFRHQLDVPEISLIEPTMEYAEDIWAFRQEIFMHDAHNENQFAGCLSLDTSKSAEEWIRICKLRKSEATCDQVGTSVPSHMFLAIRKSDGRIVGIIDLRHHIDHPILGTWGGHCGYSVRPSERGKGYAKEMLRLNVQKAKELGIDKMLVTCDEGNPASEKVILENGGVYEKTIEVDGSRIKRYWIMFYEKD